MDGDGSTGPSSLNRFKLKAIKIAIKRREIVNPKAIFLTNFSLLQ